MGIITSVLFLIRIVRLKRRFLFFILTKKGYDDENLILRIFDERPRCLVCETENGQTSYRDPTYDSWVSYLIFTVPISSNCTRILFLRSQFEVIKYTKTKYCTLLSRVR